ncbi:hypothetical protein QR685DRAFT_550876 [Neurospora intermedia]|uniref:Uncharacterized protein n=1 Tax=Neurospora intermedia TaxID=5142 RepID=A0ABR3DJP8_NEUIN
MALLVHPWEWSTTTQPRLRTAEKKKALRAAKCTIDGVGEASEQRHQAYLKKKRETFRTMKRDYPAHWRAIAAKNSAANKRRYRRLKENNPEDHAASRRKYAETYEAKKRKAGHTERPHIPKMSATMRLVARHVRSRSGLPEIWRSTRTLSIT